MEKEQTKTNRQTTPKTLVFLQAYLDRLERNWILDRQVVVRVVVPVWKLHEQLGNLSATARDKR